jgi:23S rRNA pseudouridine1911/1915/1917 synthase
MKYIGHPLFNDDTYGGDKIVKGTVFAKYRQFVDNCFTFVQDRHCMQRHLVLFTLLQKRNVF